MIGKNPKAMHMSEGFAMEFYTMQFEEHYQRGGSFTTALA
jgi:hypothetical protein